MTFLLLAILFGCAINLVFAARFYFSIRFGPSPSLPVDQQEDAVVILSVRGCDPSLRKTVTSLLHQNFYDYRVIVVVDSRSDPAWNLLQQIKFESDQEDRLQIQPMDAPRPNCSLKCSSIIGAVESLPATTRWLAFVDADVNVYPNWLSDLLGPLANPSNCVTTGHQWFEPQNKSLGATARSIWNAGAIVPSALLRHPWAGSMGVKYEDVVVSTLIDDWKTAVVDDGPVTEFAKQMNANVFVVPKLMMVNREDCTNSFCIAWISRMLTWSKRYESTFWITMVHATVSAMLVVGLFISAFFSVLTLGLISLINSLLLLALASGLLTLGYWLVRCTVSASLRRRSMAELPPLEKKHWLRLGLLMAPMQLLYLYCCIKAGRAQSVVWRGVEYKLNDDGVELVQYLPYQTHVEQKDSARSL